MNMSYNETAKIAVLDKLIIGLIVVAATFFGNVIFEKMKIVDSEKLKSVEGAVRHAADLASKLDYLVLSQESVSKLESEVDLYERFSGKDSDDYKKALKILKESDANYQEAQKKLHEEIRLSHVIIGKELQGHFFVQLSYISFLYNGKRSLHDGIKNNIDWQIENSKAVVKDNENKLAKIKLDTFIIRDIAIKKALP
jgi:hypothetical protein